MFFVECFPQVHSLAEHSFACSTFEAPNSTRLKKPGPLWLQTAKQPQTLNEETEKQPHP
jgi:hypothetical protein